jgi:hypothetical protein
MTDFRRRSPIFLLALLMTAALGLAAPARAQEDSYDLQVTGYGKFSPGAKFSIERTENTELSSFVQARLKEALERHGFTYGKSSQLVMTISAEKVGSNERPASATYDQSTAQFRLSMGEQPPASGQIGRQFRISVDLYDRKSGQYLWRARITDARPSADPFAVSPPMIEQLAKAMDLWAGPSH